VKKIGITQRLSNRLRRRGDAQQRIAAFEGHVRAWGRRKQSATRDVAVEGKRAPDDSAAEQLETKHQGRTPLRRIRRAEGSLEQLYDAVDQAHVVWLNQFHTFLDAMDVLLEARQAVHDDDEPIPAVVASVGAMHSAPANVPDAAIDPDGWDEHAHGGVWEGGPSEQAS
jgi:hypothetical protein